MKTIQGLKITAMLPLALMSLIFLIFGLGETIGGDITGIQHFVQLLIVGSFAWLGWKRPLWGGIVYLAAATASVGLFWRIFTEDAGIPNFGPLVIITLPLAFSGLLLLLVHWLGRMHPVPK